MSAVILGLSLAACNIPGPPPSSVVVASPPVVQVTQTELTPPQDQATSTPTPTVTASPTIAPSSTPTITPLPISAEPADIGYLLPLVVQHVTDTEATVFFELQAPAEGLLLVESSSEPTQIPLPPGESYIQMTIADLVPNSEYTARVLLSASDGFREPSFQEQMWGPLTFHTAGEGDPLRVGVIGDSGFGDSNTYALVSQMEASNLDMVLHTGDVVYQIYNNPSAQDAYALKWFLPFAPLLHHMPIYPVVGNHDVEETARVDGIPYYYHVFPPFEDPRFGMSPHEGFNRWYAFAYGDIQFIMLDTQVFYNEPGLAEQNLWLEDRLADDRFRATIVVTHVPPFTSSSTHLNDGIPVQSWLSQFDAADIALLLSGHSHDYERLIFGDQTYIVTGGGSAALYPVAEEPLPQSQVYHQRTHFTLLEIHPDRIDITAVASDGETLDEASVPLVR